MGKRERITYLELLRGILIIAVVAIHTTSFSVTKLPTGSTLYPLYYIVNVGCNFAVPGFLFLSALLLFYHYDGRQLNWLSFYKKRIKKVVVPYLFWPFFMRPITRTLTGSRWSRAGIDSGATCRWGTITSICTS